MEWLSTAGTIASGLGSSAPAMASGGAYGSPISVGGLNITKKPDLLPIIGALLLGGAVVWLVKH